MPTTDQLQTEIDALSARVNSIDGQGLSDPALAQILQMQSKIAGLQTTIRQSVLAMEQALNTLKADLATLKGQLQSHLGA